MAFWVYNAETMRVLLDTHAFIWWVTDDPQLSDIARDTISNSTNILFLSAASTWEIVIKYRTGKLSLPDKPDQYIPSRLATNQIESLPIQTIHTLQIAGLPDHHKDPFDRILIAQSQVENLPIITIDHQILRYPVQVIW
ncbi:MAG: type II toxin-antitoxin system VapC family toxin [Thermosynechococcaceae cyanobacterium]